MLGASLEKAKAVVDSKPASIWGFRRNIAAPKKPVVIGSARQSTDVNAPVAQKDDRATTTSNSVDNARNPIPVLQTQKSPSAPEVRKILLTEQARRATQPSADISAPVEPVLTQKEYSNEPEKLSSSAADGAAEERRASGDAAFETV